MTWEEYKAMKKKDASATIEKNEVRTSKNSIEGMSWQEYKRKREEQRREEEERKRTERQKKINETKATTNVLPKANKNVSSIEDLQKNYDKLSLTEQAEIAKQMVNKSSLEKLALSSNNFNNTPLYSKETIEEKNGKINEYKNPSDIEAIGSNAWQGTKKGFMNFLEAGVSAIDNKWYEDEEFLQKNQDKVKQLREQSGLEPLEFKSKDELYKDILGDSYNKDLFGRDKEEQKEKWNKKKQNIDTKIALNIENTNSPVGRKLAEIAPSIGQQLPGYVMPGGLGLTYFTGSAKGSYMEDAKQRGMTEEEANTYSGIMAIAEGLTEQLGAGLTKKVGKNIVKGSSKEALKYFGLDIMENFIEEAVMEPISETTATLTGGKETADWDDMGKRMLNSGIDGALSSIIMAGSSAGIGKAVQVTNKINNGQQVTQQEISEAVKETLQSDKINQEQLKETIKQNTNNIINQNTQTLQKNIDTNIENTQGQINSELNEILNNKELPMQGYKYESSNNAKINNLRQQAGKYFNNSQEAHKFVDMLEKIIVDKDIEIRLDANLKTADGRIANGSYSNGVITINPNSARTGEFIAIHELTHAIGTKSMMNIVENYRKSNAEFNSAVESLLQNYNATELTEEALSDVSAQLFGNQEFINNIANTNPGFFKKIYNEIKYLWHQFRGYKNQNQFVEDLYYKWTQAYNSNNKLNGTNNYSIAGINAVDNIKNNTDLYNQAMDNYNLAKKMAKQGKNNVEIMEKTGWFKDDTGKLKFSFSDKDMSLKNINFKEGEVYTLEQILNHDTLFMFYPELKYYTVEFKDLNKGRKEGESRLNGAFSRKDKEIRLDINRANFKMDTEGTLIHEIQHAIQNIEGFTRGTSIKAGKRQYQRSLGEREARDTANRFINEKYNGFDMSNVLPESAIFNRNILDKMKDAVYNYFNKFNQGVSNEEVGETNKENSKRNKILVVDGINEQENSNKSSFSMDNKGRTLTKEQQEYFKDSKVRDDNGNLLEVYHGTKTKGINIFNYDPTRQTGTDYGKAYYFTTDYIKAQGYQYDIEKDPLYIEYSKQDEKWKERVFDTDNEDDRSKLIKEWSNWHEENNVMELLNNEEFTPERLPDGETKKLYLNIKNPYIADAKGQYYFKVYDDYFKEARANGNDGIIVKNVIDVARGEHRPIDVYIAFNENQIKNIDNTNPTENPDIRYSISEDTEGRVLSKEQQDFFKDSVVRDEDGNLKIMYHGTDAEFNEFTYENYGKTGTAYGKGFYFTDSKEAGQAYGKNLKEVYLDIKKPMEIGKTTMSKAEFKKLVEAVNKETGGTIEADYGSIEDAVMEYDYGGDDIDLTNGLMSVSGLKTEKFYEILRNTLGYDGIKANNNSNGKDGNYYLAFNSNQIKNIDNINPTGNPDIRHSQNNESWQQHLDKNFKATGTRTNMKDIGINVAPTAKNNVAPSMGNVQYRQKKTMNPTEISNLRPDDANTTPELKDRRYESGNKQSSFFSNIVTDAKFLNNDLRQEMSKEDNIRYYKGITNKETLEKAYTKLQKDGQTEVLNWHSKDSKNANAEDVTEGWILLKQYQDKGDYANAVRVAKKMRDIGTTAGQTIQAYNILSRLTPEGMFYYAQSELSEAYNKMVEGKSRKWIEENQSKFDLTPEETQSIMDIMQDVATMEDGYDKKAKIAEVQKIITDKLPPSAGQSIKAWMRISMLFNTKTQVRNVLGNAVVMPVNAGSDIFASALDKLIAKKTGVRTTGTTKLKKYGKGFLKGLYESYNDFRKGINTRNIEGNRFEVSEGKSFKNKGIGKALNGLDSMLSFALDAGDRGFYEATFVNSINNQLVLNNTKEVTQDMIDIATTEALQRTWQDNNAYTQSVLAIRNILNFKVGKYKGMKYGLGDVLIPFAKTPANLTKAMVDYSPAGLIKTLVTDARKFKNSLENGQYAPQLQHRFVQNLGKGMAGTILYAIAYALAKTGIATGESDEDKDVKNFMKNSLGISSYSIKIGNKSFTYDWAQPISAPLSIMTNIVNSKDKDTALLEAVLGNLDTAGSVLLEQSFMEALNEVTSDADGPVSGIINQVLELPSRAVPTFSKQIADMVDGTQRTTFEYGRPVKSAVNSIVAKVPGLSKTLPASIDTLGNEIQKYGGNNNIFNVMFNPANTNKGKLSKAGEEIYNVYNQTGDKTIFPRTAPYYINNKGEKVVMDAHQRSDFQTISGKYIENSMNKLLNDSDYKKLDDEAKAEIINEIVSDSYSKAKYDVLKIDSKEYEKLRTTLKDVKPSTYYNYKFKTEDMKKDSEKISVLANSNYTNKEKTALYENYVGKDDNVYGLLKSTNINITEYLKYKTQKFSADYKDDGTVKGESISGSKKAKEWNYIDNMNISYTQKVLLLGYYSDYTLSDTQQKHVINYIKTLNKTNKEKMELLSHFKGITIYKNGRIEY